MRLSKIQLRDLLSSGDENLIDPKITYLNIQGCLVG